MFMMEDGGRWLMQVNSQQTVNELVIHDRMQ